MPDDMSVRTKPPVQPAHPLRPAQDPALWRRQDMEKPESWIHTLTADQIGEIEDAVGRVERSGLDVARVTRHEFVLPRLGPVLDGIYDDLINGRGFALIRGLPIDRYTSQRTATAFWGLGRYFGDPVSQNAKGHLLGHVKDLGYSRKNPGHRGYQTSEELQFHCDSCDMTALLCLHPAATGGVSRIMSSIALHNEMLRRNPGWVAALSEPMYRDRRNEVPPGMPPWYVLPVFNIHEGYLTTSLAPSNLRMGQRHPEVPRFTPSQLEALDMVDRIGAEDDMRLEFDLQRGDIELLHNHVVLHSRTRYESFPEPERHRHLLRLWMSTPGGRPLPRGYYERYGGIGQDRRPGGIVTEKTVLNVSLEA